MGLQTALLSGAAAEADPLLEAVQRTARRLVALTASALLHADVPGGTLSFSGYRVLVLIAHGRVTSPSDLAAELDVTRPAIAQILRRLETKKLIARRSHGQDGRRSVLSVTPRGRELIEQVMRERARRLRPALKRLSERERNELGRGLTRLEQALSAQS